MTRGRDEFLQKIDAIRLWQQNGLRAPHKPLLILWALGNLTGENQFVLFQNLKKPFVKLLQSFGTPRGTDHPEDPFWRLQKDGLWKIPNAERLQVLPGRAPSAAQLIAGQFEGGFPDPVYDLLRCDPKLVKKTANKLLEVNFPPSIRDDIRLAVGFSRSGGIFDTTSRRAPWFRREVLRAYEQCCAVCEFDARMDHALFALEAAHIKWRNEGGPDQVSNGLALCATHHKAFDYGAFGVVCSDRKHYKIAISPHVNGRSKVVREFVKHDGKSLRVPRDDTLAPDQEYIEWHYCQVFKGKK